VARRCILVEVFLLGVLMRAPVVPSCDASVASPPVPFAKKLRRRSLLRALSGVAGGVPQSKPETGWNFTAMNAHAPVKTDVPCSEVERTLAEEIARAMRRKPLMNRLNGVAQANGAAAANRTAEARTPASEALRAGPPLAIDEPDAAYLPPPFDPLLEDFDEPVTTPASTAQWLGKARRQRNQARAAYAVAWLATLAIGGAIISATFLLLPH
jgi:hypothetical protein